MFVPTLANFDMKRLITLTLCLVIALPHLFAAYPEKPIKIIVPASAGGGTDAMARLFQRSFVEDKLLPEKTVIVNIGGAGGVVGTRKIKDSAPDGYTIGLWNMGTMISKAMGISNFDHNDFEILAATGSYQMGFGVKEDSPIKSIEDLVSIAKEKPKSVKLALEMGTGAHVIPLLFEEETGIKFNYVNAGGGSRRLTSLLGNHTDVSAFSLLALKNFSSAGIVPIAVFSNSRAAGLPEVPTAVEKGIDVVFEGMFLWLAPKGTPGEYLDVVRKALQVVASDPSLQGDFEAMGVDSQFLPGEKVKERLDELLIRITPVANNIRSGR